MKENDTKTTIITLTAETQHTVQQFIYFSLTSVTTFVFVTEEFWLRTAALIVPPVENCMLRAAVRDFTVEELSGGETVTASFWDLSEDFASSSVILSA